MVGAPLGPPCSHRGVREAEDRAAYYLRKLVWHILSGKVKDLLADRLLMKRKIKRVEI